MTPEEAIREMTARLIHQPNTGYDEIKAMERVALGAIAALDQAVEKWETAKAERDAARRERDCSYGNARAWIAKVKANTLTPEQARRCIRWYGRDWTVEQEDDELADWLERIAGGSE